MKKNNWTKNFLLSIFVMLFLFFRDWSVQALQIEVICTEEPVEILHFDVFVWAVIWFFGIYLFISFIKLLWKQ